MNYPQFEKMFVYDVEHDTYRDESIIVAQDIDSLLGADAICGEGIRMWFDLPRLPHNLFLILTGDDVEEDDWSVVVRGLAEKHRSGDDPEVGDERVSYCMLEPLLSLLYLAHDETASYDERGVLVRAEYELT